MLLRFCLSFCFLQGFVNGQNIDNFNASIEMANNNSDFENLTSKNYLDSVHENTMESITVDENSKMHEMISTQTVFNSCDDSRAYSSLENCMDDCQRRKKGMMESIYTFDSPFTHKVLLLLPNEFIIEGENLRETSLNRTIEKNSYVLYPNGNARACLPLIKDLETCDGWVVDPKQLEFADNGQKMWYQAVHRYYMWNEFFYMEGKIVICEVKELLPMIGIHQILLIGNLLSTICLCFGVILSRFIDDLKKNILLQLYVLMLSVAYIDGTFRSFNPKTHPNVCIVTTALYQFFTLSAYFWINVQSFDLYATLKGIKMNPGVSRRRFLSYSVISWGIPTFLTAFAITAEIFEHPILRPGIKNFCYFSYGSATAFGYFYGWMGLSIFINLLLFIFIICQLRRVSQEVSFANRDSQKQLFIVAIRLVFTMGFFWISKVIAWIHVDETVGLTFWYINIISSFQGVILFLLYICRRKYLKKLITMLRNSRLFSKCIKANKHHAKNTSQNSDASTTSNTTATDTV